MITNQELRDYWKKVADAVDDNKMQTSLPPDAARATKQDSMIAALGAPTDSEATGNGSIVGILKRLRTLLGDSLVTIGSAIGNKAQLIAGSDGTNARAIKTASDGTLLTQLTGSKQEVVNVFSRSLRTSSQNTTIFRPAGAKGCIIYLTVYGVTGTFGADQGVRLRAQLQGIKGYSFGDIYTAPQTMSNRSQIIMLYPGATDANVPAAVGGSRVIAPMFAPPRISLSIVVTGTFDVGQGIDCEADIEWLYG